MAIAVDPARPDVPPASAGAKAAQISQPRVYYLHASAAGMLDRWPRVLADIAGLGFSHLLISPPFLADDAMAVGDFDRPHPAFGRTDGADATLHDIARLCADQGLRLWMDVMPDHVAADGTCARDRPDLFRAPDPARALDPRSYLAAGDVAVARYDDAEPPLTDWWCEKLQRWQACGIEGFRFASLRRLPPRALRRIAERLRQNAAPYTLLGWTPGLTPERVAAFADCGLDYVFSSLPWWNFRDEWLWRELSRLRRIARVMAPAGQPFGPRINVADLAVRVVASQRLARFAAAIGDGWMMPMGFESALPDPLDPHATTVATGPTHVELADAIRAANQPQPVDSVAGPITPPFADAVAVLRRASGGTTAFVANAALDRSSQVMLGPLLGGFDGAATLSRLGPGEVATLPLTPTVPITLARPSPSRSAERAARAPRIAIENVAPSVDQGRFAAKRVVGDIVTVTADVICEGHDQLAVLLLWRGADEAVWHEARMRPLGNDRWEASFALTRLGRWVFTLEAWRDSFATFRDELQKKHRAGVDVHLELLEGQEMVAEAAQRQPSLAATVQRLAQGDAAANIAELLSAPTARLMAQADPRPFAVRLSPPCPVDADAARARFASWYEVFPRSLSDDEQRHGTFADVERHLPRIRDMGFDVLYFPPIHPIGRTNRKGRNNSLTPAPDDPGSPYAIGSDDGGHDAIHPQLGTLDDFRHLREAAERHGLQLAIDFAIQCSPDHPWLKQHREWFDWRPDGSLRYAENPPKKYEDIVNVDFYAPAAVPDLWVALYRVVQFWAEQGVRIFRVDNPHTKPLPFWEWLIGEIKAEYADAVFLAEAFTKPKMMNRLGKLGFTQSYTYFTWRNTAREMQEYVTELTTTPAAEFFRPHFFVNTPDINPVFLQTSGRPGFLIRAALAATLASLWGVYNGFELCEAAPMPGREEYVNSEKYQLRAWDWQRPGNIVAEITQLNSIRARNPALHSHLGVKFLPTGNPQVLAYQRYTASHDNVLLVVVSFDPVNPQQAALDVPLWQWRLPDHGTLICDDLMAETTEHWQGRSRGVALTPERPFRIWRARAA